MYWENPRAKNTRNLEIGVDVQYRGKKVWQKRPLPDCCEEGGEQSIIQYQRDTYYYII
jgi:hypothetical protein